MSTLITKVTGMKESATVNARIELNQLLAGAQLPALPQSAIKLLELSKDQARIGFFEYLKAGIPVTLVTTASGFAILYGLHLVGIV